MELVVEMDSNLNLAHFYERQAEKAVALYRFDDALKYYDDAIKYMERARNELEDEEFQLELIDLQLSTLKQNRHRLIVLGEQLHLSSTRDPLIESDDHAVNPTTRSSKLSPQTESEVRAIKLPKCEIHTKEELETCVAELRQLVDSLSRRIEVLQRELSEERARRLAAEAELLLTNLWNNDIRAPHSSQLQDGTTESEPMGSVGSSCLSPLHDGVPGKETNRSGSMDSSLTHSVESWFDASSRLIK